MDYPCGLHVIEDEDHCVGCKIFHVINYHNFRNEEFISLMDQHPEFYNGFLPNAKRVIDLAVQSRKMILVGKLIKHGSRYELASEASKTCPWVYSKKWGGLINRHVKKYGTRPSPELK